MAGWTQPRFSVAPNPTVIAGKPYRRVTIEATYDNTPPASTNAQHQISVTLSDGTTFVYPGQSSYSHYVEITDENAPALTLTNFVDINATECFLAGTLISTPDGEREIEKLEVGDLVLTPDGPKAIQFLIRTTRSVDQLLSLGKMPICIGKGALGSLGPSRDTYLSPSHAIHFSGSLVEASALMNYATIHQLGDWKDVEITYYNIELESHDLITANGLLVESYFCNFRSNGVSRECWDNYSDYIALYGESKAMDELPLPRIPFARQLPAELRMLLQLNEPKVLQVA